MDSDNPTNSEGRQASPWLLSPRRLEEAVAHVTSGLKAMASGGKFTTAIGAMLEEYITTVILSALEADDLTNINFAEAALLLQDTAGLYCRNVDYLYEAVLALSSRCSLLDYTSQESPPEGAAAPAPLRTGRRARAAPPICMSFELIELEESPAADAPPPAGPPPFLPRPFSELAPSTGGAALYDYTGEPAGRLADYAVLRRLQDCFLTHYVSRTVAEGRHLHPAEGAPADQGPPAKLPRADAADDANTYNVTQAKRVPISQSNASTSLEVNNALTTAGNSATSTEENDTLSNETNNVVPTRQDNDRMTETNSHIPELNDGGPSTEINALIDGNNVSTTEVINVPLSEKDENHQSIDNSKTKDVTSTDDGARTQTKALTANEANITFITEEVTSTEVNNDSSTEGHDASFCEASDKSMAKGSADKSTNTINDLIAVESNVSPTEAIGGSSSEFTTEVDATAEADGGPPPKVPRVQSPPQGADGDNGDAPAAAPTAAPVASRRAHARRGSDSDPDWEPERMDMALSRDGARELSAEREFMPSTAWVDSVCDRRQLAAAHPPSTPTYPYYEFEGWNPEEDETTNEPAVPPYWLDEEEQDFSIHLIPSADETRTDTDRPVDILSMECQSASMSHISDNTAKDVSDTANVTGVYVSDTVNDTGIDISDNSNDTGIDVSDTANVIGIDVSDIANVTGIDVSDIANITGVNGSDTAIDIGIDVSDTVDDTGIDVSYTSNVTGENMSDNDNVAGINVSDTANNTEICVPDTINNTDNANDTGMVVSDIVNQTEIGVSDTANDTDINMSVTDHVSRMGVADTDNDRGILMSDTTNDNGTVVSGNANNICVDVLHTTSGTKVNVPESIDNTLLGVSDIINNTDTSVAPSAADTTNKENSACGGEGGDVVGKGGAERGNVLGEDGVAGMGDDNILEEDGVAVGGDDNILEEDGVAGGGDDNILEEDGVAGGGDDNILEEDGVAGGRGANQLGEDELEDFIELQDFEVEPWRQYGCRSETNGDDLKIKILALDVIAALLKLGGPLAADLDADELGDAELRARSFPFEPVLRAARDHHMTRPLHERTPCNRATLFLATLFLVNRECVHLAYEDAAELGPQTPLPPARITLLSSDAERVRGICIYVDHAHTHHLT